MSFSEFIDFIIYIDSIKHIHTSFDLSAEFL